MSSGVTVDPACLDAYQLLKMRKGDSEQYKYIVLNLNKERTEIIVEKTVKRSEEKSEQTVYQEFVDSLPEEDCRWVVYDLVVEKDGGIRNKIVLLTWIPDDSHIRQKMVFASSFNTLKNSLPGLGFDMHATDLAEVSYETIQEKVNRSIK